MTKAKPMTRANRREFLVLSFAVAGSGVLTLAGCGGGKSNSIVSGGGGGALLQGNAAVRAIAVAAHQSISGGRFYAFAAIKLAAPAGSQFSSRAAAGTAHRSVPDSIVYDDGLQLYKKYASIGGTVSVSYFKDAAGTVPAGSATVTEVGFGDFTNSYTTFPTNVNFSAATTDGTVPFTGSGSITYLDATGANTLTGSFTSRRNNVTLAGTLNLSGAGDVTGGMTMTQGGVTTRVTGITGSLSGDLVGNVVSDPYGWTGTIRFSLATGMFTLILNTGTGTNGGTATVHLDDSGNLVIGFADGTTQTITNPLSEFIDGSGGSATPSPSPTPTATPTPIPTPVPTATPRSNSPYQAPISLDVVFSNIKAMNAAGIVAGVDANVGYKAFLLAPPYTTPQYLNIPNNATVSLQIDDASEILLERATDTVYFTSAAASPQPIAVSDQALLSAGGKVVSGTPGQQVYYRSSLSASPVLMKGQFVPQATSGNGQVVGRAIDSSTNGYVGVYYSGPDADPVILSNPYQSSGYVPQAQLINNAGLIIGVLIASGGLFKAVIWSSPTAIPTEVPGISAARGLNNKGQIVGSSQYAVAWLYQNGTFTNLNDLIPNPNDWYLDSVEDINDDGWILASGIFRNSSPRQFCIIKPR